MFPKPFVILDLETSGIDPKRNEIIEVALIRYENGQEVARYTDLIKVDFKLPEIITIITGITDWHLEDKGKKKADVLAKTQELIRGAYIVGHNIQFDVGFLRASGLEMDVLGYIDTVPLSQILLPQMASYSLESLSDELNISHKNSHRAMADVEATLSLFGHLWNKGGEIPRTTMLEIKDHLPKATWDSAIFFEELEPNSNVLVSDVKAQSFQVTEMGLGVKRSLELDDVFGETGGMSKVLENWEPRSQQQEMSQAVLRAFQEGFHLVCEAPTGVGKSLAYLAAAANVAISNRSKVVISTNTVNLQEQLYEKDVPLLQKIYHEMTDHPGVKVALLKGRSHYLCLRRLAEFKRRPRLTAEELILLTKILVWQNNTQTGDSSDLHLTPQENLIWDFELSADQKFCSPQKCKAFGSCYLTEARQKAEAADIIIVNHALLCSDLVREGGLLPDYQYLVVDEAHHFEEVATTSFGVQVKQESIAVPLKALTAHLSEVQKRFSGNLFTASNSFEPVDGILDRVPDLQQQVESFFSVVSLFVARNVPESAFIENLLIDKVLGASQEWTNLGSSFDELHVKLKQWLTTVRHFAEMLETSGRQEFPGQQDFLDELLQEISILADQLNHLGHFFDNESQTEKLIRYITSDMSGVITLSMAPLLLGTELKEKLYTKKKSIVYTSATLGVDLSDDEEATDAPHPFRYVRQMLGLDEGFEELILPSPFDYEAQTYIITPTDLHPVVARNSIDQVSQFMLHCIRAVGGSMLGLFTSHGALEKVYMSLMQHFTEKDPKLLAQRITGGRGKIMKAYMNDPTHSVLFGTNSFWEGVDLQGEALTTLVIHKLPFDVPSDPVFNARSQMFGNPFMEYSVPRAILRFRQGFGRLIRSKKDFGALIVLDNRVLTKDYGKMFLKALPRNVTIEKMKLAEVPEKVKMWLDLQKEQNSLSS